MPTDLRALVNARPTGQRAQQIISGYVSFQQPAPSNFWQPLYVVIPSVSHQHSHQFTNWPQLHGGTLPQQGTPVVLVYDETRQYRVIGWDGVWSPDPYAETAGIAGGLGGVSPLRQATVTVRVSPGGATVARGQTTVFTVTLTGPVGQPVDMSCDNLPDGTSAGFDPWQPNIGGTTALSITPGAGTIVGSYPVVVVATGNEGTGTAALTLLVV